MDLNEILGKIVQENKLDNLNNFNDLYVLCVKNGYEKSAEEFVSDIKYIFNNALNDYISEIDESEIKNVVGGKLDFKKILSMPVAMLTLSTPFINNAKALTTTDILSTAGSLAVNALSPKPKKSSTFTGIVKLLGLVVGSGITFEVIRRVSDYCIQIRDSKNLVECVNNFVSSVKDSELTDNQLCQCYADFIKKSTDLLGKNGNTNLPEDIKNMDQSKIYNSLKSFIEQIPGKSKELFNNALEALKSRLDTEQPKQKNNQQSSAKKIIDPNQHENEVINLIEFTTGEISKKIKNNQEFDLRYIGEKIVDICYETFLHAYIKGNLKQEDVPSKDNLLNEMIDEYVNKNEFDEMLQFIEFRGPFEKNFEQKDLIERSLNDLIQRCNEWKDSEKTNDNTKFNGLFLEEESENEESENQDYNAEDDNIVSILKESTESIKNFEFNVTDYGDYYEETSASTTIYQDWKTATPTLTCNICKTWYCQNILSTFFTLVDYLQENSNKTEFIMYDKDTGLYYSDINFKDLENKINSLVQNQSSEKMKVAWKEFLDKVR